MFDMLLKTITSDEQKKNSGDFAEFQKKFSSFEKAVAPVNEKTKKDLLYGRNYNAK